MDVVRVSHRSRGDEQPLVTSPAVSHHGALQHSPAMSPIHHNGSPHPNLPHGGRHDTAAVPTTHFPSHPSPSRQSHSPSAPLHSPTQTPTRHGSSRCDSPHKRSSHPTPSRHSHDPGNSPHSSPTCAGSTTRYSHPLCHRPSAPSSPINQGVTLTPLPSTGDTSKIIQERNKSVTIVLGEQQVTYSSPHDRHNINSSRQHPLPPVPSSIVRITDEASPKLSSLTSINTTNDVDALSHRLNNNAGTAGYAAGDKNGSSCSPILSSQQQQPSYHSTAYTSNGGGSGSYSGSTGIIKSWNELYSSACLPDDGCSTEDWRRSTSTLVPASKTKSGGLVSWRGVACSISGVALVVSAAALLRLPALLLLYGPGSFVLVLVACLLLVAAPLALLEAGLAQFSSCSVLAMWRLLPIARGVGWSLVLLCCVWGVMAAGLTAPWLHYFLVATTQPGNIKSVEIGNCSWASVDTPQQAMLYYRQCVYSTSAEGGLGFNWPLPAGLLALCFTAFIGGGGGRTMFTVISAVSAPVALAGVCVQGCVAGWRVAVALGSFRSVSSLLLSVLQPNLAVLAQPQVWLAGLGQSLLMLGPGTALLLNHASHRPFRSTLRRHVTLLTLLCLLLTLLMTSVTVLQIGLIRHDDRDTQPQGGPLYAKLSLSDPSPHHGRLDTGAEDLILDALQAVPSTAASPILTGDLLAAGEPNGGVNEESHSGLISNTSPQFELSTVTTRRREEEEETDSTTNPAHVRSWPVTGHSTRKRSVKPDGVSSVSSFTEKDLVSISPRLPGDTSADSNPGPAADPTSSIAASPRDSTLPVLSLMSPNAQTTHSSQRVSDATPTLSIRDPPSSTDTPPVSTTCTEETQSLEGMTTPVPLLGAALDERSEDCVLRIIKFGPEASGPCSHGEVSVGSVFLLTSYSLLPQHLPTLPWVAPVLAAVVMCGVLFSGVSSLCSCLYVGGVAGRESGGMGVVVGAGAALLLTLMGAAPLVAQGGLQLLCLLDVGILVPALIWPSVLMTTAIAAAHGMNKLRKDFTFMLEKSMSPLWVVMWAFLIPCTMVGVFAWQCVYWWKDGYYYAVATEVANSTTVNIGGAAGGYDNVVLVPWWQMAVMWMVRLLLVLPIPVVAVRVINSQLAYGIKDKLVSSLQSSRGWGEWGPQDPIEHHNWRRWREDETRPFASLERRLASRPLTYTHSTLSRNSSGVSSMAARLRSKYQKKEPPPSPTVATAL